MDRRHFLKTGVATAVGGAALAAGGINPTAAFAAPPTSTTAAPDESDFASSDEAAPNASSAVPITSARIRKAVGSLDGLAKKLMSRTGIPGLAIAVVHQDKVVYAKGFGVRKVGSPEKIDTDTVFQLASLSKSVASTVVAGLVGQGLVAWDDPISKYLPDFRLADPYVTDNVTIADMFSHRSGLPDHAGDLAEDLGYEQDAVLARLQYFPLSPFRTGYAYTNFGLTAGAVAAAAAAKKPWTTVSQEVLYTPLGMTSTSSTFDGFAHAKNRAYGHVRVDPGDTAKKWTWEAKYTRDADAESPAGGVSSSVNDMAKWLRLQLAVGKFNGTQVIDEAALFATQTPHSISGPPGAPGQRASLYALGIGTGADAAGRVRLSHSGAFALGAGTNYVVLPSADLGIVVLGNGQAIGVPEAITFSFFDLVETGKVQRDWYALLYEHSFAPMYVNHSQLAGKTAPASPSPALAASAYTGVWANPRYGPATVTASGDALTLALGPKPTTFPLTHWDANTFSYLPTGENAVGISAVTFTVGTDGKATTMNIENFNGEDEDAPLGNFTR
jgi:CubicO group peptidase (beta-lactamase class C family)